jgi:hypothetical protein
MKKSWSVLAICQQPESRQKAVQFCDELVQRFWDNYDITVSWFTHAELRDPAQRRRLHEASSRARLIVFEAGEKPIPTEAFRELEECLRAREQREGLLAGIVQGKSSRNELTLRNLAHRAGMDFISEVPPSLDSALPDSP